MQKKAHSARPLVRKPIRFGKQGGLNPRSIAREPEIICGVGESIEVQIDQWIVSVPEHGFDQRKRLGCTRKKLRLEPALAKLRRRLGIDDNATPDTHGRLAVLEHQGADGHIENRLFLREESDGAGINSARIVFDLSE